MKRKVCACGVKSVPGLIPGVALCQKHFDGLFYRTGPDHLEAVRMLEMKPAAETKMKPAAETKVIQP